MHGMLVPNMFVMTLDLMPVLLPKDFTGLNRKDMIPVQFRCTVSQVLIIGPDKLVLPFRTCIGNKSAHKS